MAAAGVRERAWHGRLNAEAKRQYFGRLADRYRLRHTLLVLAFGIISAVNVVVAVVVNDLRVVTAVLSGVATVVAIIVLTVDFSQSAARADSASVYYERLARLWKDVWWRQHDPDVVVQIRDLEQQDAAGPYVPIADDEELIEQCEREVDRVILSEYSGA